MNRFNAFFIAQAWYIDLTYQHTRKGATFHAYTPYQGVTETPSADLTLTNNNIIISTGFKFLCWMP